MGLHETLAGIYVKGAAMSEPIRMKSLEDWRTEAKELRTEVERLREALMPPNEESSWSHVQKLEAEVKRLRAVERAVREQFLYNEDSMEPELRRALEGSSHE